MHIPLDQGVMEPKGVMMTIRGGGELLLAAAINPFFGFLKGKMVMAASGDQKLHVNGQDEIGG